MTLSNFCESILKVDFDHDPYALVLSLLLLISSIAPDSSLPQQQNTLQLFVRFEMYPPDYFG
jgi:hypothetical protein